jgi:5-methylcytosine-specific restriction enzyme subunit McrC
LAPRNETLVESVPRDLELSLSEARALSAAGKRLMPTLGPSPDLDESDDGEPSEEPSLIKCTMSPGGTWRVTVSDAVGLIAVGDLRILVEPKIPRAHLFHLLARAELLPRITATQAAAAAGPHLWELVCRWLLDALEQVVRRDLIRDYLPRRDALEAARGQIDVAATARTYYTGSLALVCDYEEYGADTPLNRILRAAALAVSASADAALTTRKRATRVVARMQEIGSLQTNDLRATLDRRTAHYREALTLARTVLANTARALEHGDEPAWTFLIRTPELVEAGIRNELHDQLEGAWDIRKETIPLSGVKLSVSPDLVIGDAFAIADVKYKRTPPRWRRADLYEVTAFAAAAKTSRAAVIGFRVAGDPEPPPTVGVGHTWVRYLAWQARQDIAPADAASALAQEVARWLSTAGDADSR